MSRGNIIAMRPVMRFGLPGLRVTFSVHEGGTRTYDYDSDDGLAIIGGADPANFNGEWVDEE